MLRLWLAVFAVSMASAQISDPVFARIPFDRWTEAGQTRLRWRPEIVALGLTNHQRLLYRIQVKVDGAELAKRKGNGELVMLVEFKDSEGRAFQTHGALRLADVTDEISRSDLQFAQDAFLAPGEYQASLAVYASATGEYALVRRKFRVDALPRDPLPEAWRDLPPVEFLRSTDPPDSWFQPQLDGRLHLPVPSHRPIEIELLVNATPSEEPAGSRAARLSQQMIGVIIPSMKTLGQMQIENGAMSVAMFDLARQKVTYQSAHGLNWDRVKDALAETNPHMIDVGSLEKRQGNAQFFVKEVARRVEESSGSEAMHFLIVLSAPMTFAQGEDLHPIQISAGNNCKVFYFRYSPATARPGVFPAERMPTRRGGGNFPRQTTPPLVDSLERTLKPLNPRLFEITTPLEFRKSMASMIEEITKTSR